MRSVYIQSFEHLNKVGFRAIMNSKLEEQKSVTKLLLLEVEKPCHIFSRMKKSFSKACTSFKWQLLFQPQYSQDLSTLSPTTPKVALISAINQYLGSRSTSGNTKASTNMAKVYRRRWGVLLKKNKKNFEKYSSFLRKS